MMFFHLTGIKDISDKNYTLEFLIEAEDIAMIKSFLATQKVITLGLEQVSQIPMEFSKTYLIVPYQGVGLKILGQFDELKAFIEYALQLGLEPQDANYFASPIAADQVQELIHSARQQHQEQLAAQQAQKAQQQKELNLNFNDKKLQKSYQAIDDIINQIDQLLEIGGEKIDPSMRKKLDDIRGNISKLRLATNYDKIIEELHTAMNLIVTVQDILLEKLESNKIFSILPNSQVQNVEIIREQTRLSKAKLLHALGAQLSREETMYVSLGYLKIFSKYLAKDIAVAMQNKLLFTQQLFKGLEVTVLFVMLEVAILSVFAPILGIGLSLNRFGIIFIYIALFGGLLALLNHKIKPQSPQSYRISFVALLGVYALLIYGLKILFIF